MQAAVPVGREGCFGKRGGRGGLYCYRDSFLLDFLSCRISCEEERVLEAVGLVALRGFVSL